MDIILFHRKKQLGLHSKSKRANRLDIETNDRHVRHREISPMTDLSQSEIDNFINSKTNLVDGVLVFNEFIKE